MGGLYTPFKDFLGGAILTEADLDGLQAYLIAQHTPQMIDDYSATVGEMQTMVDPGEVGTESQAANLAGEIARLRKLIAEITGKTNWYESPAASFATGVRVLNRQSLLSGTDANTNEKILGTYTLPANTLTAIPQAISVIASINFAANANVKTGRIRLGGIGGPVIATVGPAALNNFGSVLYAAIMYLTSITTVGPQFSLFTPGVTFAGFTSTQVAAWTAAQDIVVTGQNGTANANDLVCRYMEVSFLGAP